MKHVRVLIRRVVEGKDLLLDNSFITWFVPVYRIDENHEYLALVHVNVDSFNTNC